MPKTKLASMKTCNHGKASVTYLAGQSCPLCSIKLELIKANARYEDLASAAIHGVAEQAIAMLEDRPEEQHAWRLMNSYARGDTQNQFSRVDSGAVLGEVYGAFASARAARQALLEQLGRKDGTMNKQQNREIHMTSIELKHKNEFREMLHRLHNEEFESSTCCTAQFAKFAAVFRQCMSRFFKTELEADIVRFSRGHFEITGFMHRKSGWWYFNTGDLRSRFMHCELLLRSAKHDKDYSGGHNQYVPTITAAEFKAKFKAIVVAEQ